MSKVKLVPVYSSELDDLTALEKSLNDLCKKGWSFNSFHQTLGSKKPHFAVFTQSSVKAEKAGKAESEQPTAE